MPLSPGQTLNNRYRIVKLLGQGGFGAVYRGWDINLDEPVAIKECIDTSEAAQRQFKLEAKLLFKLHHANLPRVHDHFILPGQGQYLVMDFVEGQDLEEMLKSGSLPETKVLPWIMQVCDALSYLHSQDPPVIHRDIKPSNIKITPGGQAMLVDFGIAKVFDAGTQTTIGARALTPGFAPPEQYGKGKTDARTDLYALGATLYTVLTKERPLESVQRAVMDELVPPEKLNPKLASTSLCSILHKALEINPDRRFQSAADFKSALQSALKPEQTSFQSSGTGMVSPTVVAPMQAQATQPTLELLSQGRDLKRWGWLAGISGFILVAILVMSIMGIFLFNLIKKADNPQTPPIQTNIATGEMLAVTQAWQKTPSSDLNPTPPIDNQVTSTMFTSAEKPSDIPVMPGAKDVQTYGYTQGKKNTITIYFTSDLPDDEIIAYYEREMAANGWTKFSNYSDANNVILYFMKGDRVAMMMISQTMTPKTINITTWQE